MRTWWERYPRRLERELAALDDAGIEWERDVSAAAKGILRLSLLFEPSGRREPLVAIYPDLYPFFRPEVYSRSLELDRHQNPIEGNLCLLDQRTSAWNPEKDSLARIIQSQLPQLLRYADTGDLAELSKVEAPQGEPASTYYNSISVPNSYVLIDSAWSVPASEPWGTFTIRAKGPVNPRSLLIQGYVAIVTGGSDGKTLFEWSGTRPTGYDHLLKGVWLRRSVPIIGGMEKFQAALSSLEKRRLLGQVKSSKSWHTSIGALIFPEEVTLGNFRDGWTFVANRVRKGRAHQRSRQYSSVFLRTARAGNDDLAARMPASRSLADKSIAIFGLGALGAPAALELARSGVGRLVLVDHDIMDPPTARRWPLGWSGFGELKGAALRRRLAADYPGTRVDFWPFRLGAVDVPETATERQGVVIDDILRDVDAVLDATAETAVAHFLVELGRIRKIPVVVASGTAGTWGGSVVRFLPTTPCWVCFEVAEEKRVFEPPPIDPKGIFQPAGCPSPTFTGSAFDITEVSLEAVRVVCGLLAQSKDDYPITPWDVGILHLRGEKGDRMPPVWERADIPHDAGCPCQLNK